MSAIAAADDTARRNPFPEESPAARRYMRDVLCLPRSGRERFLHRLGLWNPPLTNVAAGRRADPLVALIFATIRRAFPSRAAGDLRCVAADRSDQDGRRRVLAFVFERDGNVPIAMMKAQHDTRNGALSAAAAALTNVRSLLPPTLQSTVARVLHYESSDRGEVLVTSGLSGRSAYAEMASSILPARLVDGHFHAAAQWLGEFHEATRVDDEVTASHGDYWAHNILADGDAIGVVDWEHFQPRAPRSIDLFFYPLTYGLNYPWNVYARVAPLDAFERTFLQRNRVSRAVHDYLQTYSKRTGVALATMRDSFARFLETDGTMGATAEAHPGVRSMPWASFRDAFRNTKESVFL